MTEPDVPRNSSGKIAVVSASGGLDSTALLVHMLALGDRVQAVGFNYGQKHGIELERLAANVEYLQARWGEQIQLRIVDLSDLRDLLASALTDSVTAIPLGHYEDDSMRSTFVPNRNAIFASIIFGVAVSQAQRHHCPVRIGMGVHAGDHAIYPDCRPEFHRRLFDVFRQGNWGSEAIELYLPYLHATKAQILSDCQQRCQQLRLDFETILRNTCTSYWPDACGRSHGLTGSDVERILAFDQLGLRDPLEYALPWPDVVASAKRLEQEFRQASQPSKMPRG